MKGTRVVAAVLAMGVLAAAKAMAQDGEVYIPEESGTGFGPYIRTLPGPFDAVLDVLLLGGALFPLVAAWSCLQSRKYESARRWTFLALVLACAQGGYGVLLLLDRSTTGSAPSWFPGMQEIVALMNDPPEWAMFLGAGALGATAAWWTARVIAARRSAPASPVAGSRVRVKGNSPADTAA